MSKEHSQTLFTAGQSARVTVVLFALAAVYTLLQLGWYSLTPLGLSPVLDGKENLLLAGEIASGNLEPGPFYRAMLYPALLSLGSSVGEAWLPMFARMLNGLAHLFAMLAVLRISMRVWRSTEAALLSAALYGFYPVALFFAGDPLDITFSIALALWGLEFSLSSLDTQRGREAALGGTLLGLAVLARPHFLPVVLILPAALWFWRRKAALLTLGASATILALGGAVNFLHSGSFAVLPSQGAFNLWAANREGASGRWFQQTIELDQTAAYRNPARVESEILFQRATGLSPAENAAAMPDYWRKRFISETMENPLAWLQLMIRKTWYLLNNDEAYNNKTYRLHKDLSPWLRFNPLGWSALIGLFFVALVAAPQRPRLLWLITGLFAAYAAGLLLYYVSARFRLPLAPLLAIGAGGAVTCLELWREGNRKRLSIAIGAGLGTALLLQSNAFGIRSVDTTVEDRILLAQAASEVGEDRQALKWAREALEIQPQRHSVMELAIISQFNLLMLDPGLSAEAVATESIHNAEAVSARSRPVSFIFAVHAWNLGRREAAVETWAQLAHGEDRTSADAMTALRIVSARQAGAEMPVDPFSLRLAQILSP